MKKKLSMPHIACAGLMLALLMVTEGRASAQNRDSLLNGAVIGAAIGAGVGVGFSHAVRDSDLTVGQYAYGAVVFGAIGAGIGLGVDALLSRSSPPRLRLTPTIWRNVRGVAFKWRF